jgi:hypothetical protein
MDDEQQETADDAPEGAVDPETLKADPGPPQRDGDNMAGPRKAAEERATHAAEAARAAADADAGRSGD